VWSAHEDPGDDGGPTMVWDRVESSSTFEQRRAGLVAARRLFRIAVPALTRTASPALPLDRDADLLHNAA